jgi:hypothetical protein
MDHRSRAPFVKLYHFLYRQPLLRRLHQPHFIINECRAKHRTLLFFNGHAEADEALRCPHEPKLSIDMLF